MKKVCLAIWCLAAAYSSHAQDTPATEEPEEFNFDNLSDADDFKVKTYCTQKVNYLSPTQLISIGYEYQSGFPFTVTRDLLSSSLNQADVNRFAGLRLAFNAPVISRSNFILNMGLTYWNTSVGFEQPTNPLLQPNSRVFEALEPGLRSTGINATVFKPLDNKHFLIFQGSADVNGTYRNFEDLNLGKSTTFSATAIYGWKKDDNTMFGVGATRTYRAGQVLHIPVIYYNKTFNPKWGIESIFPAKVHVRRNFGTNGSIQLGYEIEGNSYYLGNNTAEPNSDAFLRRGELKPRVMFQRKITGFIWVMAQAGLRYNYRFNIHTTQNPVKDEAPLYTTNLGNPFYGNISINLVSP